jgi:hypothetical protein
VGPFIRFSTKKKSTLLGAQYVIREVLQSLRESAGIHYLFKRSSKTPVKRGGGGGGEG